MEFDAKTGKRICFTRNGNVRPASRSPARKDAFPNGTAYGAGGWGLILALPSRSVSVRWCCLPSVALSGVSAAVCATVFFWTGRSPDIDRINAKVGTGTGQVEL